MYQIVELKLCENCARTFVRHDASLLCCACQNMSPEELQRAAVAAGLESLAQRGVQATWIRKAHESSLAGATVVCLIPARTDTRYWHDYVVRGEIRFIKGRLKFGGNGSASAPFPSAVVVFRPPLS
jgi:hypothetical protein